MNAGRTGWRVALGLAAALGAGSAAALELGPPLFAGDIDDRFTVDVVYQRMDRDIRQQIAFTEDRFSGRQEEDRIRAQVLLYPAPAVSVRLDAGVTASDGSESPVPLGGLVAKVRLATWRGARLVLVGGGTYVEAIEYQRSGALTPAVEVAAVQRIESYSELGAALQLSRPVAVSPRWTLHPYVGVEASWLDADGTEQFTLETNGRQRTDHSVDFREDSPFMLSAGVAALANRNFGARVEAHVLHTASFSAGVFFSF